MNDAELPSGSDCYKTMAPLCLHLSAIRGCVLNQPSGVSITLCVHARVGVSWIDSLRFVGSGDQRTHKVARVTAPFFIFLFSSPSCKWREVEREQRKDWKLPDVDYTECCSVYWRRGHQQVVSVPTQQSYSALLRLPACLCRKRPGLSLWMSRLQTVTVSGPLYYWLILPGRTRYLLDRWERPHVSQIAEGVYNIQCTGAGTLTRHL